MRNYDIWLQEPYMAADACETCGGDSFPCECDEAARDEAADRKWEESREAAWERLTAPNPSDGHQFRTIHHEPGEAMLRRVGTCDVCRSWPEEHACDNCGERQGDHSEEMRGRCEREDATYRLGEKMASAAAGSQHLPPTCGRCSGIGHTAHQHEMAFAEGPESEEDRPRGFKSLLGIPTHIVQAAVLTAHAAELRAMADDLRDNLGPIGTPGYIARSARAEAYEECAKRLERDAQ